MGEQREKSESVWRRERESQKDREKVSQSVGLQQHAAKVG